MTFLRQQSVAAIARTERPDFAGFREMTDVLLFRVTAPGGIRLVGTERRSHRMQSPHEFAIFSQPLKYAASDSRHNVHADDNVSGIGDLDSNPCTRRTDGSQAVRNHVHGPARHAAGE